MIEIIIYFLILTIYLKLPLFEKTKQNRSLRFNGLLILLSIAVFIYSCYKIATDPNYIFNFVIPTQKDRLEALLIWVVLFITLFGFTISHYYMKDSAKKQGLYGAKGNRGLRGGVGGDKKCNPKECTKDICFKKILTFCSKKYRKYAKIVNKNAGHEPIFANKFLMKKMRRLCKSDQIQKMFKKDGYGNTYRYIYIKWDKFIRILLKYEHGLMFIESDYLNDNDFNNMITENDKLYASFENLDIPGTPSQGTESPFDEMKKYDIWYWGESNAAMPKIIYKCEIENKKDTLKRIESNHYKDLWESTNARQAYVNKGKLVNGKCVRTQKYVPFLRKGTGDISVYRPEILDVKDDLYFPLGDVIMEGKVNEIAKTHPSENDPNIQDKLKTNGPIDKTELVTGDTKHPIDFEQIFKSPRESGEGIGIKGYSIWKPIPPPGYKCLGYILDNTPNMVPPSADTIVCVPEKCVRKYSGDTKKIWSNKSPKECYGDCGCDQETGTIDTDNSSPLDLYKTNTHYFKSENDFYELIPENEDGSCFDRAKERETDTSKWKVYPKNNIKYSVNNIYASKKKNNNNK
jgi:hypothetical protein